MATQSHWPALARAFALGFSGGLRFQAPVTTLSLAAGDPAFRRRLPAAARWLGNGTSRAIMAASLAGEVVVDKLPGVPPRVKPEVLSGRIAAGALTGGLLGYTTGRGAGFALVTGGTGAFAAFCGAQAGYHARTTLTGHHGLPDAPVALVEDVCALAIAASAVAPRE